MAKMDEHTSNGESPMPQTFVGGTVGREHAGLALGLVRGALIQCSDSIFLN